MAVRANLLRSYSPCPLAAPAPPPAEPRRAALLREALFGLCMLHAAVRERAAYGRAGPPPLRTNRTRRVLFPVLIGHAVSCCTPPCVSAQRTDAPVLRLSNPPARPPLGGGGGGGDWGTKAALARRLSPGACDGRARAAGWASVGSDAASESNLPLCIQQA